LATTSALDISRNTILAGGFAFVDNASVDGSVTIRGNIFAAPNAVAFSYMFPVPPPRYTMFERNLYFNASSTPPSDTFAVTSNPLLASVVDPIDPTPLLGSPAVDAQADTGSCADFYGVYRPQGESHDLGAVERVP
jgi:hypothetical protein